MILNRCKEQMNFFLVFFSFLFLGHNSNHLSKLNFRTQHPFQVPQLCSCYKTCPDISHCFDDSKAARGYHCFPVLCGQQQQHLLHSLLHCQYHCCDCCSVIHTISGYVNSSTRYGNYLTKALSLRSWALHWEQHWGDAVFGYIWVRHRACERNRLMTLIQETSQKFLLNCFPLYVNSYCADPPFKEDVVGWCDLVLKQYNLKMTGFKNFVWCIEKCIFNIWRWLRV